MKRALVQMAALALLGASAAQAAPPTDPMAGFYGNTVTIAVPPYYFARRYVDPDGTWREPRGSAWIKGAWKVDGGQICSWQTEPAVHEARRYCYPIMARKVGEEWTTVDPDTGAEVFQKIEPGRSGQP
ncbi:MAG: hypothetical protein EPO51_26605 [Phenylobacterium sp.]|uniref:hypothetical protein n=1 Tax=Phenylobacterium sp. TaxID=1871053 RepID=UPI0012233DB2|nr:hypothetical protein [Phenylobacterium sp.]TAJ68464.1 MAG: hypothetical protein EPO51_26605 [Phenylobacterium sp.]